MQNQTDIHAPVDFDFIIGDWTVSHQRLDERLCGCTTWTGFQGRSSTHKFLDGFGNLEDNILYFATGEVRAAAIRSYDSATRTWSIWWLDGRAPHNLDAPVIGSFSGDIGTFYANDFLNGKPIKVRFIWQKKSVNTATWKQAFSPDGGTTWETNWTMEFTRSVA
ncbi:MAG: DUF1579 domain-containing protein [Burkholderiaceae bacterium]|nr:DUF1579 domain-containing protein [Burkholderiaceae bacterium]